MFQHTGDLGVRCAGERGEAVLSNPRRHKMPYAPAIAIGTLISFFCTVKRRSEAREMSSLQPVPYEFPEQSSASPQVLPARDTKDQGAVRNVATKTSPFAFDPHPEPSKSKSVSVAVISPSEARRAEAVSALEGCTGSDISEFTNYPPDLAEVPQLIEEQYDAVLIDLDSDPGVRAGPGGEHRPTPPMATVMVYSENTDPELLVRCMQAGAREFLTLPFSPEVVGEALVRAAARRPEMRTAAKAGGKAASLSWAPRAAPARPRWPAISPWRWPRNRTRRRC